MVPFMATDIANFQRTKPFGLSKRPRIYLCIFRDETANSQERWALLTTTGEKSYFTTMTLHYGVPPRSSDSTNTHVEMPTIALDKLIVLVYVGNVLNLTQVRTILATVTVHEADDDGLKWVETAVRKVKDAQRISRRGLLFSKFKLSSESRDWKNTVLEFRERCVEYELLWRKEGDVIPILDYYRHKKHGRGSLFVQVDWNDNLSVI